MAKNQLQQYRQLYTAPALPSANIQNEPPTATANLGGLMKQFKNRMLASLDPEPEGKVDILVSRGVPREAIQIKNGELFVNTRQGLKKFDEDEITIYDFADMLGDAIPMVTSIMGSFVKPGTGTVLGGVGGDAFRQGMAKEAGSERGYDVGQTALEGAFAAGGELLQRGVTALLKGPAAKKAQTGAMKQVRDLVGQADKAAGTEMMKVAPPQIRTASPFIGGMANVARTNQVTTEIMREADEPLFREFQRAISNLQKKAGSKGGPTASSADAAIETGERIRGAIETTTDIRQGDINKLYTDFFTQGGVDRSAPIDRTAIDNALNAIENTDLFKREGNVGVRGIDKLASSMELALGARTFDDVRRVKSQIYEELNSNRRSAIPFFDDKVETQMRNLADSMHYAEMEFLRQGGGTNSPQAYALGRQAADAAESLFRVKESGAVRRAMSNDEKGSQIARTVFESMTPEEIINFKISIGQQGTPSGLRITKEGADAWASIINAFFENLKTAGSISSDQMKSGMYPQDLQRIISGKHINNYLDGLEKSRPGSVEALLGTDVYNELRTVARALQEMTQGERSMANFSNTARYVNFQGGYGSDIVDALTGMFREGGKTRDALARLAARAVTDVGIAQFMTKPGLARYMLGETKTQQAIPNDMLRLIGRTTSQVGVRQLREE